MTDRCGIAEFIDGKAGLVVEYNDAHLHDGLCALLENTNLREKFSLEGPRLVKEQFSLDNTADSIEDVYNNLIKI